MLVLLAGVAALLKYASDQGWLRLPIELRLAGVVARGARRPGVRLAPARAQAHLRAGGAGRRDRRAAAGRVRRVQADMTCFRHRAAFALSVVLIAGLGVLAVLQDSRTLAVLGILAGFLAPIWLSTGSGNHVALFSYYALLNAAIFAIAWAKSWRVLNLLGFVFTFGIGTSGACCDYRPGQVRQHRAVPAAVLRVLPAAADPVRAQASGQPRRPHRRLPGVRHAADRVLAAGCAARRRRACRWRSARSDWRRCMRCWRGRCSGASATRCSAQAYALLAVGFATLAVPLALSARATACVFALEGAAPGVAGIAAGQRDCRAGPGLRLQLAAALAFFIGAGDMGERCPRRGQSDLHECTADRARRLRQRVGVSQRRQGAERHRCITCGALLWWCGNGAARGRTLRRRRRARRRAARVRRSDRLARRGSASPPPGAALASTTLGAFVAGDSARVRAGRRARSIRSPATG